MSFWRETAFSPESMAGYDLQQKSFLPFEGEAKIVGGVLELATD